MNTRFSYSSRYVGAVFLLVWGGVSIHAAEPLHRQIDQSLEKKWQEKKIVPSGLADDATFLRRIYLDLVGQVPTYEQTVQFLQNSASDKREKLIDQLLADPRFNTHQAQVWDLVFFGRNPGNGEAVRNREPFRKWLGEQFAKNVPYDRWVQDMLLGEQEGTETFYVQYRNQPEETTVAVSRIFLGTQLQCARCHDHPFEEWTQKDFYGMAGFFVRLVVQEGTGTPKKYTIGEKNTGEVLFTGAAKDQKPGLKGEPVPAKFLGGDVLKEPPLPKDFKENKEAKNLPKPIFSRKAKIAEWIVSPKNPFFTRAVVNRVWAQFMGRGLVHPVDDLGEKSDASVPELLDRMSQEMQAHQYDLKWFIREVTLSKAYQMSAQGTSKDALPRLYERARVRPLTAEEIMASFWIATGHDIKEKNPNAGTEYFMRYFGEPTNGQGDFQGSLQEHLFLNNGEHLRGMLRRKKGNLADTIASSKDSWEEKVDRLYLTVLNRKPTEPERSRFVNYLKVEPGKGEPNKGDGLLEDAIWVLVNCSEFRFNH